MAKRGKRYTDVAKLVNPETQYDLRTAIGLVKQMAKAKFDETIEVHLKLGVDPRHADQQVRGTVVLPHGTGQEVRVAAFAKGEKAKEAEDAGADIVGDDDLAAKVEAGEIDFDVVVATPDMMGLVGRLGRVLGPRGLMPNPRTGTVTIDIGQAISDIRAGKVEFRTTKDAGVHVIVGKASFDEQALHDNLQSFFDAIVRARPSGAKGQYVRRIAIASTMGPGIRLNPHDVFAGE